MARVVFGKAQTLKDLAYKSQDPKQANKDHQAKDQAAK